VAAYGILGHIKYVLERKQADAEANLAEAVTDFNKKIDTMLATPSVAEETAITTNVATTDNTAVVTDDFPDLPEALRRTRPVGVQPALPPETEISEPTISAKAVTGHDTMPNRRSHASRFATL
jgi:hypothetical protein